MQKVNIMCCYVNEVSLNFAIIHELHVNKYQFIHIISDNTLLDSIDITSTFQLTDEQLSAALNQKISSPNRVVAHSQGYADIAVGLPDLVRNKCRDEMCIAAHTYV